ncbi:hypothetical protein B0I27_102345 [Arcticibacter pallidicorallinus]|uniref:Uncharacterized protein n=2 Tax=Arcticibacter pallidicorallinus TaxID=1259464 RepID=A0A2T0U9H9_9SPHI|nr:hypothetical protein B0I27_102345 [Arcticibacter pallidicorallinus]
MLLMIHTYEKQTYILMKKIAVIALWFGPLHDYFRLWTRSLRANEDYDFLLFTDQDIDRSEIPDNLKVTTLTLEDLKDLIRQRLHIKPTFEFSYKLCDFRPAFGELFAPLLTNYDFWGYCDMDLMFGKVSHFLTDDILSSYKKIFNRGHLTLYKNEEYINTLYRSSKSIDAQAIMESNACFIFDEWHGIHQIFKEFNIPQYHDECIADINPNKARYTCSNIQNYKKQLFVWENGLVKQYFLHEGSMQHRELAYIHFQKRKICINDVSVYSSSSIALTSLSFIPLNQKVSPGLISKYDQPNYLHFLQRHSKRLLNALSNYTKKSTPIDKSLISKTIEA